MGGKGSHLTDISFVTPRLFVILAPALMAASFYMAYGRLISFVGEEYSPVRAKRVTLVFVIFDVASFVIQGGGGSLYSSSNVSLYNIAKIILLIGFAVQVVSFGTFGIMAFICQSSLSLYLDHHSADAAL